MNSANIMIFDEETKAERDYWIKTLGGDLDVSNLSPDFERPREYSGRNGSVEIRLDAELNQKLAVITGGSQFLIYTTLVTALKTCLYRYNNSETITVGSPVLKQATAGVGQKANVVAIKDRLSGSLSFKQLLLNVRETLLAAYARSRYPFTRIVKDLGLSANGDRCPLFDIAVSLSDIHSDLPELRNDITLRFTNESNALSGFVEFNNRLFAGERIERFTSHFINVLRDGLNGPDKLLSELRMLGDAERDRLLIEWNDTRANYPRGRTVHQWFETKAEQVPDSIAVMFGQQQLTYAQLNIRANQLAHHLKALGVGPDVLVGLAADRSIEMVIGLIGILKAGGAYVPFDSTYPVERLAFMLEDTRTSVLLTQQHLRDRLPENDIRVICLDSDWEIISNSPQENLPSRVMPDNLAYVIYTSGSTGKPKGVMIPHQGLMNYLTWCSKSYPVSEGRGSVMHSPIGFDLTITSLFPPLLAGKAVVLLSESEGADEIAELLSPDRDFSLLKITPAHLDVLRQCINDNPIAGSVRALVIGGEALYSESLMLWRAKAPTTRLINEYGPTETVVGCCTYEVQPDTESSGLIPIGRPIANTRIYLLDPDLNLVASGATGEIFIAGEGLARGYLNRPDLTASSFISDPLGQEHGARLYKTGDLAHHLSDGSLVFLGRNDRQVKVRGYRIELGEIEDALSQHPAVQHCAVVVREDVPGDKRLTAYVVAAAEPAISAEDLRAYLTGLPEYMVPGIFVRLDALPLTPNGKLDHRALPVPSQLRPEVLKPFVAPKTEVEQTLAAIWSQVLKIENIGVDDHFFELGGHSLTATQVIARMRKAFQIELPLRTIFDSPTVAKLSTIVEQARGEAPMPLPPPLSSVPRDAYRMNATSSEMVTGFEDLKK